MEHSIQIMCSEPGKGAKSKMNARCNETNVKLDGQSKAMVHCRCCIHSPTMLSTQLSAYNVLVLQGLALCPRSCKLVLGTQSPTKLSKTIGIIELIKFDKLILSVFGKVAMLLTRLTRSHQLSRVD